MEGSRASRLRFALFTKACQLPQAADGSAREFARSDADVQRNPDSRRETIRPPQASALERRLRRGLGADLAVALHAWAAHLRGVLLPGAREAAARGREAVRAAAAEADAAEARKAVRGGERGLGVEGAQRCGVLGAAEAEVRRREAELAYVMWYGFGVDVRRGQQQQQQQQGHGQGQGQRAGAQPHGGGAPRDWRAGAVGAVGAVGVPHYVLEPRVVSRRLRWCGPDVGLLAPFGAPSSPPPLPPRLRVAPAALPAPESGAVGDGSGEHAEARGEDAEGGGWGEGVDGAGVGAGEEEEGEMGLEAEGGVEAEAEAEELVGDSGAEQTATEDAQPRFPFTAAIQIDGSQHLNSNHTTVSVVEQQRVDRRNDLWVREGTGGWRAQRVLFVVAAGGACACCRVVTGCRNPLWPSAACRPRDTGPWVSASRRCPTLGASPPLLRFVALPTAPVAPPTAIPAPDPSPPHPACLPSAPPGTAAAPCCASPATTSPAWAPCAACLRWPAWPTPAAASCCTATPTT